MAAPELEVRRKRIETVVKWGLGLTGAAVISPFVFLAVKGIVGLVLAWVVGMAVVNFAPVVAMKFANWKLKGIKAEAAKNPVETLQKIFMDKTDALGRFEEAITEFSTKVKNLSDKVESLRKKYPEEADKFQGHLEKMQSVLDARKRKYTKVKKALLDFAEEIKKAQVVWEVSQAAQEATSAAGMGTDDPYERIKAETAVESVQNSLNEAIAELETDLLNEAAEQEDEHPKMLEEKVRPAPLHVARIKTEVSR